MKKLMFGAAIAATGMTFAATPAAQVYDVTLSIKTTAAGVATINNKTNPFLGEDKEVVVYRKQANKSWKGLIWGCNCEAIDGVWEEVNEVLESGYSTIKGCIIWDTKTKQPVYIGNGSDFADLYSAQDAGFEWDFLQAIDKDGKKVEGVWTMQQFGQACGDGFELFNFKGAGFGTLCIGADCTSYVKSISGNFAGYMKAPTAEIDDNWSGCVFCGYTKEEGACEFATAWNYCECDDYLDEDHTAAYGTWSVKYNSSLSQKLSKPVKVTDKGVQNFTVSIRDVYNFKSLPYVSAAIAAIENTFWEIDPTGCDELAHALALAKENTYAKEQAVEAVKYENLKKAQLEAEAEVVKAAAAYNVASTNSAYADEAYTIANGKYETALYNQTNVNATIIYKNNLQAEFTNDVVGCAAITAKINALDGYTLIVMRTSIPGLLGINESYTWAECKAVVAGYEKATVDAKAALTIAEQNKVAKAEVKLTAARDLAVAADAKTAADNNLANINLLQYKAAQDLEKAEAAEAAAQKAYDDAGCND